MTNQIDDLRRRVARLAREYLTGGSSLEQFMLVLPPEIEETEDDEVSALLDLIEHEPSVGGLFGVTKDQHRVHMDRVRALLAALEETSR